MAENRSVRQLIREHPESPDKTLKLGNLRLRLNPSSYSEDRKRVVVTVQTAGGYGRYDYGMSPPQYTVDGTTGLAGVQGKGGIDDLRQFAPQAGRPDTAYPFYFPGEFRGVRFVKVTEWQTSRTAQSPFFHDFHMILEEYPPQLMHPAKKVPGAVLHVPLPVGGSNPTTRGRATTPTSGGTARLSG